MHSIAPPPSAKKGGGAGAGASSSSAALAPGQLVAVAKDGGGRVSLCLVDGPDGKSKVFVTDARGHRSSVAPKAVALALPGGGFTAADLERFAAAGDAADESLLEIAWAIAADSEGGGGDSGDSSSGGKGSGGKGGGGDKGTVGAPLPLRELAALLFDSDGALELWQTFALLARDRVWFKQQAAGGGGGGGSLPVYAARSPAAVEAARQALEEERRAEEERAAWAEAARAARAAPAPGPSGAAEAAAAWERWASGPHGARVKAIRELAVRGRDDAGAAALAAAKEALGAAGVEAEPAAAWRLLADLGAVERHAPVPLLRAGAPDAFPAALEAAARALAAAPPPDRDAAARRDLTHLTVFTIDDAGTTEVDDGLSVEPLGGGDGGADGSANGAVRLWVHVADPTRWVDPGSPLDLEARARARTLYLPFGSVPMFPAALAEGPFSLGSGAGGAEGGGESSGGERGPASADCCALSVAVELDADGAIAAFEIAPSTIRVAHRLTYDAADADLALGPEGCRHADLQALYAAARLRRAWRLARGAIEIEGPEAVVEVPRSDLGAVTPRVGVRRVSQWESAARQTVAEMMILAGEAAGERFGGDVAG